MRKLVLSVLLLAGGCASTEPARTHFDTRTGSTHYETARFLVGMGQMSTGLVSQQRVLGQAFASCAGPACQPEQVELAFVNVSSSDLNLDTRRVQVFYDGAMQEWEDESRQEEPANYAEPQGEFMRILLPSGEFARVAQAKEVEIIFGETGTTRFKVSFGEREALREMATLMRL